jgi:hypothetical protein
MDNLDLLKFARRKRKNYLKIFYGILFSAGVSIVLAGQIGINLGNLIEFGQGTSRTSVCDDAVDIVPTAELFTFANVYSRNEELSYIQTYLAEIGQAVSSKSQWDSYLSTSDDSELLNRINFPFFYLNSVELKNLNVEDCDGKIVKIMALSPNPDVGPASFRSGNILGNLYNPNDAILEFKVNQDSLFSNYTDTDYVNTLPYITATDGATSEEKNIKLSFISDYNQLSDYKFLTQSISKIMITTTDDNRPTIDAPELSNFVSILDGAYVRINNYNPNNGYSFRILSQNGAMWYSSHLGDGLHKIVMGTTTSSNHQLGIFTTRNGYQPRTNKSNFSQIDSASLSDPLSNIGFARTGTFSSRPSAPSVQISAEFSNFPTPLRVRHIIRDTSSITQADIAAADSWTGITNQYSVVRGSTTSNIRYEFDIEYDKPYYFRYALFDDSDNFLAISDELTIPSVIDRRTVSTVDFFDVIYPN